MMNRAIALTCLACVLPAAAQTDRERMQASIATRAAEYACKPTEDKINCYVSSADRFLLDCLAVAFKSGAEWESVVRYGAAKKALAEQFAAAKAELGTNERAVSMLKDHYAAWLSEMSALMTSMSPRPGGAARIHEMGQRLKLER
jgi:hypothetical protein